MDSQAGQDGSVREHLRRWFVDRDKTALEWLLAENLPFLHAWAHGRIPPGQRPKHDTGDLIQDAIVEFLRYSPAFEVESLAQLRGLLCKIVQSVLSGHHRWFAQMRRDVAREKPLPAGTSVVFQPFVARDPSPSANVAADEREAAVRLAIMTLDPTDQKIVWLRHYRGMGYADVAREVELTEVATRRRFARALQRVSHKLRAQRDGDVDGFLA